MHIDMITKDGCIITIQSPDEEPDSPPGMTLDEDGGFTLVTSRIVPHMGHRGLAELIQPFLGNIDIAVTG